MSKFKAKMHQNRFWMGLGPRPQTYSALLQTPSWNKRVLLLEKGEGCRKGRGRGRSKGGRDGKGEGKGDRKRRRRRMKRMGGERGKRNEERRRGEMGRRDTPYQS